RIRAGSYEHKQSSAEEPAEDAQTKVQWKVRFYGNWNRMRLIHDPRVICVHCRREACFFSLLEGCFIEFFIGFGFSLQKIVLNNVIGLPGQNCRLPLVFAP